MKRVVFYIVSALMVCIIALMSAPALAAPEDDGVLRVGGSTTLLSSIATAASDFMEKYATWDKVDPKLPKKNIVIYVTGGGSGFGIQSTIQGTIHIGLVSRDLKDKEKDILGAHRAVLIGKDAVAFVANKGNPLAQKKNKLAKSQVAAIFSGEVKTYRDIDRSLPAGKIVLFVRDSGAGSAEIIQKKVMGDKQVSKDALQLPSQGALLKKIESNKAAMAYISAGIISGSDKLHAFAFEGIEPSTEKILNGEYSLVRPLLLVVKEPQSAMVDYFINYLLNDGQKILQENGYIPVKAESKAGRKKVK